MFAIQEPAGQRLEHLPLERLEHELTRLASDIYAGTCRWLELVAEFDRREAASRLGFRTTAEWIAWRCALSPRTAREHVRVARALGELPAIHAEFSRGALSYAKVKALTRVADRDSEAELLELARYATASQLERLVRAYRRIGTDEARDAHEGEYLAWSWEEDGSLSFRGRLASEDGALLLRALEAGRDRVWRAQADEKSGPAGPPGRNEADTNSAQPGDDGPAGPSSTSSPAARQITNVEALVEMADASLSPGAAHRSGPERYQVVVHVDEATLARDADGRCELEGETGISSETARRLACDSSVVSIVERGGASLRVGRKSRRIPPALARALRVRDGGCQFPGCERRRFADAHHIHHWAKGGETDKDNLLLLCRHHHRLVHEGGFSVERLPDGRVRFRLPTGMPLGASSLPNGDPGRLPRSGPDQIMTGSGERMDLAMNADRVVQIAGPP